MATLYNQADSNIRKTWFLVFGFLVFIIGLGWLFSYVWNDQGILIFATIFSIATSLGSYWYSDKLVLSMTRAVPVRHDDNPQLYHILENLCITAGLPTPKLYIIEEQQPNAFATGRNAKHAVVVVTRGLLNKLEKTELEGVLAHELSHIGNKDILLGTIIVILVGIVVNLSNWFFRFGRLRSNDSDNRNSNAIFLILTLVAVIIGPIAAQLIQLSISRKREFLADASGALLTRYPEGLARALEKISSDQSPARMANNSTAHLFIASPFKGKMANNWFVKLFSTHPPIEERVKALRNMEM